MKKVMPQEIEVWYLIPALRRELAKILIKEYGLTQRETAKRLGLTEAAVSQYLKEKRGKKLNFNPTEMAEIKKAAKSIYEKDDAMMKCLYGLCKKFRTSKVMCDLHRLHDKSISKTCKDCM